ncbi:MAG: hypothetical protein GY774_36185 [Planctomycetes bacterium]|nr:hypothetical protein [Planctomycetota bacterium]
MQIPVINGIYTNSVADFRTSYPVNLVPVPQKHGISNGYLRPGDGIVSNGTGTGVCRGGINWNGVLYRAMGQQLVSINASGAVTDRGAIGGTGQVTFDYSFDRLSVSSNNNLYYWDGALTQVTDPDLGIVLDHIWVDGYFMTTDGEYLVVTELSDPTTVLTTKYGSSEADPDPVQALLKLTNEPYALNRYTIEVFTNIGGTGFPFQRVDGAQIQKGTVGTHACAVYMDNIAFVGGGRNESIAVWLAANGQSAKISTHEIDLILADYTESVLSKIKVEVKTDKGHQHLYIHLPDQTIVYDYTSSQALGEQVWFHLETNGQYRAINHIYCYNAWQVGDPLSPAIGYLTNTISTHWGELIKWEFGTIILYNEGYGGIFHELELVCLTGRTALGVDPTVSTQYTLDGEQWSNPRYIKAGKQGNRSKRLIWLNQGHMKTWRAQKFTGTSDAYLSVARLDARIEPLND